MNQVTSKIGTGLLKCVNGPIVQFSGERSKGQYAGYFTSFLNKLSSYLVKTNDLVANKSETGLSQKVAGKIEITLVHKIDGQTLGQFSIMSLTTQELRDAIATLEKNLAAGNHDLNPTPYRVVLARLQKRLATLEGKKLSSTFSLSSILFNFAGGMVITIIAYGSYLVNQFGEGFGI